MSEIRNARIEKTMLGYEDHGVFSFWLYLDYGGEGQGAGGFRLDSPNESDNLTSSFTLIAQILKIVGVEKWEDLPGEVIRVKGDRMHVEAIGNFLNDKWLDFAEHFQHNDTSERKE